MSVLHRRPRRLPTTARGRVLGRLPAGPSLKLDLADYTTGPLPEPPASVPVPKVQAWGMDGNDAYGDCTIAAAGHAIATWNALVDSADSVPTEAAAVAQYKALTGCVTAGDAHDTGLVITTVLTDWATNGLFGDNRAVLWAPVRISSVTEMRQAIAFYGGLDVGVNLPQSAEEQFETGEPWTYVGDQPIGGHCIWMVGYGTNLLAVTWGAVVEITEDWWDHYGAEAYALVPQEFAQAGHGGAPALNVAALKADISRLAAAPKPKRTLSWWQRLFG